MLPAAVSALLLAACGGGTSAGSDSGAPGGNPGGTGGAFSPGTGAGACGATPAELPTGGKTYYIAPNGSDSAAGTEAAPFRTMARAAQVAGAGDIVYLRDGVYKKAEDFTAKGAVGRPVVFMAAPGEHPVLDGDGLGIAEKQSILQLYRPAHVVIAGLELRNSTGRGLQLIDANDVIIRDCTIHDVAFKAIGLVGENLVAERNTVYNAVMDNANSGASGGWAAAVTTQVLENGSPSKNVVVRGNVVRDSWGECIDALFVDGMSITGNQVEDCYSVGIYSDTSRNVRIEGNLIRAVESKYGRNGHLFIGVLLAAEDYGGDSPNVGAEDVVIANNIIVGTYEGIAWWNADGNARATNTYQRLKIVSNVVWGIAQTAISFDKVSSGRTAPNDVLLADNILHRGTGGGGSLQIGDANAWTIVNNVFPEGVPSTVKDATNLGVDPQLAAPSQTADAEAFRPASGSPCYGAGRPVAEVPLDYACVTRGAAQTTIGAFE